MPSLGDRLKSVLLAPPPPPPQFGMTGQQARKRRQILAYGSAHLLEAADYSGRDISPVFSPRGCDGFVTGLSAPNATTGLVWNPKQIQGHALTFGATRSGKGVSSIIPALLTYSGSILVVDPKAEAVWVTAERRRQLGHRVVILDPWNETNRRYGGGKEVETLTKFNPLRFLDAGSPDFAEEVSAVGETLIVAGSDYESHWINSARDLVAGLIAADAERNPGKASLRFVRKMVTATDEELSEAIKAIVAARPDGIAARKLKRFMKSSDELSSIRSTAQTQTAILDSETLLNAMETDESPFDLAELATSPVTVYLVLPPDRLFTHGRWLRMILTLALRAIARQVTPPQMPVLLSLDEAGSSLGNLSSIESAFGLLAGLGVRLWMYLQDLNQLQRDYPKSWETFIANASLIQVLTARDNTTAEYFEKYLGSETQRIETGKESFSEHARPIMTAQEIREMNEAEMLVLYPGNSSSRVYKPRYYDHPSWKGQFRPLPNFS